MSAGEGLTDDPLFYSASSMADAANYADWTFSLFAPFARGEVLEVGCGVGTFTRLLSRTGRLRRCLSIDISAPAVAHCRADIADPRLELRVSDVRDVTGSFDFVLCMNVLEHIEDDRGALAHMVTLLRPGGTLFLLVPAHALLYSDFDRESGHHRRYDKRSMRKLLGDAVPASISTRVRLFYFNTIGALGYFAVYRMLRKQPRADAGAEIGAFDRYIVPVQRRVEPRWAPFGISLVAVITRS